MKKVLIVFLASLMILSLAACGGKTDNNEPSATDPVSSADGTQPDATEPAAEPDATTEGAAESTEPAVVAMVNGSLNQLDMERTVVRGLSLAGNRSGSDAINNKDPAAEGIRCVFELNEWVEVTPDTDAKDGLGVWVFRHKEDPNQYLDTALSEETDGYAAYCDLPFDPEAEANAPRGSFYLNPDDCEAGFYDLVLSLNGEATAVLNLRFVNEGELEEKSDAELMMLMDGMN